ncbi:MAG: hypothetical protein MJ116_05685 [Lachnospiraceae bacterium]|nr:hypothetical protein [Lachnospiraceae bacterium]
MSCKAALYAANVTEQTIDTGGIVNFGNPIRRFGQNISVIGGNVILSGQGYYEIATNITFSPNGAGPVTVTILADGVPVPGAVFERTTANGLIYSGEIPAIIRVQCCKPVTITVEMAGATNTVTNAAIVVEKI